METATLRTKRRRLTPSEARAEIEKLEGFIASYQESGNWYLEAKCHALIRRYQRIVDKG